MRELLAHHGEVKLWHDHGGVVNNFTVTVGPVDRWVFSATNRDEARAAANTAWKALADGPTDPEAVATVAVLALGARTIAADWADRYGGEAADWFNEALTREVTRTVNEYLKAVPGAANLGGPAWPVRLNAAVKAAVHAPA